MAVKKRVNKMRCDYCSNIAVYHRKISNEFVCKTHFIKTVERKIRKTVRKYKMFSPKDKVVVGVSGGKDSLVLLYNVLQLQKRYSDSPKVEAILIDEGIEGYRAESIQIAQKMCNLWEIPLHIVKFRTDFGETLDKLIPDLENLKINACTICGTVRRRLLNDKAFELNADRLAIGHNLDDQIETFLQNIVRNDLRQILLHPPNGNIESHNNKIVPRIKPLMAIPEKEITLYCYYKKIPIQTTPCPYVENYYILRKKIQDFINILNNRSPEIKYNLLKINENIIEQIPIKNLDNNTIQKEKKIGLCKNCQMPCGINRDICYYCELKKELNLI
ncbi:MAG: TIGR00269 family protein [Promethearchaeota archaeon]